MATERQQNLSNLPPTNNEEPPASLREFYKRIRQAAETGRKRAMLEDAGWYINLRGIELQAFAEEVPNRNKLVIIAPNHFSRGIIFTTEDSFLTASVVTVALDKIGFKCPISWFMKRLKPNILDFRSFRDTQNAAAETYDLIPTQVGKNGRSENLFEMQSALFRAIERGYSIGISPEQKPSYSLRRYDISFIKFLRFIKSLDGPTQIVPASIFINRKKAEVKFGKILNLEENSNIEEIANTTMIEIAKGLPLNLRGQYST